MDRRAELTQFLRSRRARLRPEDVGLRDYGGLRRVPGLRREELAQLAGVSVDHYVRLEQGRNLRFSLEVLDAVSRALRLTPSEREHLRNLALPEARVHRPRPEERRQCVRPGLVRLLETVDRAPAYVLGRRADVLAWNRLTRVLFTDYDALPESERNLVRLLFLDERGRAAFHDWRQKADELVAFLRLDAGRRSGDPVDTAFIDELSERSPEFLRAWREHSVRGKGRGRYRLRHPAVGDLDMAYETVRLPDEPDQFLVFWTCEPGGETERRLRRLAALGGRGASLGATTTVTPEP